MIKKKSLTILLFLTIISIKSQERKKSIFSIKKIGFIYNSASANNFLPAGDTHIIYPGKNGPLSSLRFESHRIGSEDYEILEILKRKKPKKHKKLVGKVFTDYQTYSLNIKKYYRVKKRILKTPST